MFSDEDVRDIFRLVPPGKALLTNDEGPLSDLPSLLISTNGAGFITASHVFHDFERLIHSKSTRLPVALLSRELGIDPETVLQLVRISPSLGLLSEDKSSIITKDQRDSIEQQLRELVARRIVSKATFSREKDISTESLDSLTRSGDGDAKLHDDLLEVDGHIISKAYQHILADAITHRLNEALIEAVSVELSPELLPGLPPTWYISQSLDRLLRVTDMTSQFRIEASAGMIRCVPKKSVLQKRDAEIARLQAGEVSNIDLQIFSKQFHELYPSLKDVQDHVTTLPEIYSVKFTAISEKWILGFSNECVHALETNGYVEFTTKIKDYFPPDCQNELYDNVQKQINIAYEQRPNSKLLRVGIFMLAAARYDSERGFLLESAKTHAATQWQQLKENSDKDLKFQMSEIINNLPSDRPVLRAVAEEKSIEKAMDEQYWGQVSNLESQNEAEFSKFWNERFVSRIHNYTEGLKAIEDTKLRDQLADLLSTYIQKELLPDTVSKARSQGLVCSRKTRKNAQKLESTLKPGKTDISGIVAAIEKFGKKQGVPELDTTSLAETKSVLVSDMARKMQKKQADGPLLFLTLVIVLFAKYQPGVVYATGKFAPKLLKQLKPSINSERYEQLENWKELAKAGTLGVADRDNMKRLASEA